MRGILGFALPAQLRLLRNPIKQCRNKHSLSCALPESLFDPPVSVSRSSRTAAPPGSDDLTATSPRESSRPKVQIWKDADVDKPFYVVDGMALVFRAYYGLKNIVMTSRMLENTRGVYGFLVSFLWILETQCGAGNVAVVFEGGRGFRNELYEEYKATRMVTPGGVKEAVPWVKEIVQLLGVAMVEVDGWEGDDVIATLVTVARRSGISEVVIISDDKDLKQVLGKGISILKSDKLSEKGFTRISAQNFAQKHDGLSPENLTDLMALTGDKSDNIPGVRKVGPKTALSLVKAFGSLEAVLSAVQGGWSDEEVKSRTGLGKINKNIRNMILEDSANAILSKKLVTVNRNVPLGINNWSQIERRKININALNELLESLDIRVSRFRKRFDNLVTIGSNLQKMEEHGNRVSSRIKTLQTHVRDEHSLFKDLPEIYDSKDLTFTPGPVRYSPHATHSTLQNVLQNVDITSVGICALYRGCQSRTTPLKNRRGKSNDNSLPGNEKEEPYDVKNWYYEGLDEERILGMAVSFSEGASYYVKLPKSKRSSLRAPSQRSVSSLLYDLLENPNVAKYGRGLKSLTKRLERHHGVVVRGCLYDVDICNTLLHYGRPPSMSDSIELQLGTGAIDFFLPGTKCTTDRPAFRDVLESYKSNKEREYETCARADLWMRLVRKYREESQTKGISALLDDVESPLVSVLAAMEMIGVGACKDEVESVQAKVHTQCEAIKGEIAALLSERGDSQKPVDQKDVKQEAVNLHSNDQVAGLLFKNAEEAKVLGWKGRMTKTGKASASAQTLKGYVKFCEGILAEREKKGRTQSVNGKGKLKGSKRGYAVSSEELQKRARIASLILDFRGTSKIISQHTQGLLSSIDKGDGRIHAHFAQLGSSTGRLSVARPNLQTLPVRSEIGSRLRAAIKPRRGFVILCADYSQIELRILAAMSKDESLISAFRAGEDIHSMVAALIFNLDGPDKVDKIQRRRAKAVSYGIPYGLSMHGLAQGLGISRGEAKNLMVSFHEAFPGVEKLTRDLVALAHERGYAETWFCHRRLHLPHLRGSRTERSIAERVAINMPIQGTQADMIKLAMVRIHNRLIAAKARSRMILQIHDELVLEVANDEKNAVFDLVKEEMAGALPLPEVEVVVEMAFGSSWLDATPH